MVGGFFEIGAVGGLVGWVDVVGAWLGVCCAWIVGLMVCFVVLRVRLMIMFFGCLVPKDGGVRRAVIMFLYPADVLFCFFWD